MNENKLKTPKPVFLPTILVIGGSKAFLERCRRAAVPLRAFVKHAVVAACATEAARSRPRVLLMTHETYASDPTELDALARDVRAHVVRIESESISDTDLELAISDGLAAGDRLRRATTAR